MGIAEEPTYITKKDGSKQINPFFKPGDYEPYVLMLKKRYLDDSDPAPSNIHEHSYVFDNSVEPGGTPVVCTICQMGKTLHPSLTLRDGKIVAKDQGAE